MEVINTSAEPTAPLDAAIAAVAADAATTSSTTAPAVVDTAGTNAAVCGTDFAAFEMPSLQCNEDGWGPCELSNTFRDMPYQPFSKSDRMGKISDWTGSSINDKKFSSKYRTLFDGHLVSVEMDWFPGTASVRQSPKHCVHCVRVLVSVFAIKCEVM